MLLFHGPGRVQPGEQHRHHARDDARPSYCVIEDVAHGNGQGQLQGKVDRATGRERLGSEEGGGPDLQLSRLCGGCLLRIGWFIVGNFTDVGSQFRRNIALLGRPCVRIRDGSGVRIFRFRLEALV